jgi:hypothetical protein
MVVVEGATLAGPFGAIVLGFVTAGFTLVVAQYAFSFGCCSRFRRLALGMM